MSDKEPRKRKKKREGQKRVSFVADDLGIDDSTNSAQRFHDNKDADQDSEEEVHTVPHHEPSIIAKIIFLLLSALLVVATGTIFLALQGADRGPVDVFESSHVLEIPPTEGPEIFVETEHLETLESEEETIDILERWQEKISEFIYEEHSEELIPVQEEEIESKQESFIEQSIPVSDYSVEDEKLKYQEMEELEDSTGGEIENDISTPFVDTYMEEVHMQDYKVDDPQDGLVTDNIAQETLLSEKESLAFELKDIKMIHETEDEVSFEEELSALINDHLETLTKTSTVEEILPSQSPELIEPTEHKAFIDEKTVISDSQQKESEDSVVLTFKELPELINEEEERIEESKTKDIKHLNEESGKDFPPAPIETHAETLNQEPVYENADITNEGDFQIREELDGIDEMRNRSLEKALKGYKNLLKQYPESPRALFGKASVLDKLAEEQRSNSLLEEAITNYRQIIDLKHVPDKLLQMAGSRLVDRMRFRGFLSKAVKLQLELEKKFPNNIEIKNQLAVSYLMINQNEQARKVLKEVLRIEPCNGFAKVHLGFILKIDDKNYPEAIKYMTEGIASREQGVIDGRFFFHLGDALARTGQKEKAMMVYEQGVEDGIFLSVYQRSLYNVNGLTAKPWWNPQETPFQSSLMLLEKNWEILRKEGTALLNEKQSGFLPENEGLQDTGNWKQFDLYIRGQKISKNCKLTPKTCALLSQMPDATGCKRGQIKFSLMDPGTHVWAHTGPTNCRLRAHLGLTVPEKVFIRVANETRNWKEGKILLFDDSFEHEVWHNGTSYRLVLIIDFWHPEITDHQKTTLSPI